jgi:hypothetical protein
MFGFLKKKAPAPVSRSTVGQVFDHAGFVTTTPEAGARHVLRLRHGETPPPATFAAGGVRTMDSEALARRINADLAEMHARGWETWQTMESAATVGAVCRVEFEHVQSGLWIRPEAPKGGGS